MCHCRPLLARSNLFLPSRNCCFSGSNKRNKARASNLPEGRGAAKKRLCHKSQPVAGGRPAAGRQGLCLALSPGSGLRDSRWTSCFQPPRVTVQGPPCLPCGTESPPFWRNLTRTPAALTALQEVLVSRTRAASGSFHLQGAGTAQSSCHLLHYFWGLANSSCSHSHFSKGPKNPLGQEPNPPGSFFSVSFYNNNLGLEPQFGNK